MANLLLAEEESIINRRVNLLANAANPSRANDIKTAYIEVLNKLTPVDSLVLDKFYSFPSTHQAFGPRSAEIIEIAQTALLLPQE